MTKKIRHLYYYKKTNKKFIYPIIISIMLHIMIFFCLYKQFLLQNTNTVTPIFIDPILKAEQYRNNFINSYSHDQTHNKAQIQKKHDQEQSNRLKISNTTHHSKLNDQTHNKAQIQKKHDPTLAKNTLIHNQLSKVITDYTILEDLLNNLTKHNIINNNKNDKSYFAKIINNNQYIANNNIKTEEINLYKNMISESIQKKFYNASDYAGKECKLKIQLAPDGKLVSVDTLSGDLSLSHAATVAVKLANIPAPPNIDIYKIFKNTILKFSP